MDQWVLNYLIVAKHFSNLVSMMEALTTNHENAPNNITDINFVMK
jgi:hypothetical protein